MGRDEAMRSQMECQRQRSLGDYGGQPGIDKATVQRDGTAILRCD